MKKILLSTLSLCMAVIVLAGCGASGDARDTALIREASADYEYSWDDEEYVEMAVPSAGSSYSSFNPGTGGGEMDMAAADTWNDGGITSGEQKIAHTYSLNMQTREFDQGIQWIEKIVQENGGLIQDSYIQGISMYQSVGYRYANYTLRMPTDDIDSILDAFEGTFNITDRSHYQDNITAQYYDTQSRINSLVIQRDKLMAMLEEAEDVATLLEIERELSNVLYQIDSWQTSLNYMDDRVDYATIHLSIEEVVEYSSLDPQPTSFQSEIGLAVKSSWISFQYFCKDVVFGMINAVPYIVVGIVLVFIFIVIRRSKKKQVKKSEDTNSTPADK